jgi:hypothetical protein
MGRREQVHLNAEGDGLYSFDVRTSIESPLLLTIVTATGSIHTVKLLKR